MPHQNQPDPQKPGPAVLCETAILLSGKHHNPPSSHPPETLLPPRSQSQPFAQSPQCPAVLQPSGSRHSAHVTQKVPECLLSGNFSTASRSDARHRPRCVPRHNRLQGLNLHKPEPFSQKLVDSAARAVKGSVRTVNRDSCSIRLSIVDLLRSHP